MHYMPGSRDHFPSARRVCASRISSAVLVRHRRSSSANRACSMSGLFDVNQRIISQQSVHLMFQTSSEGPSFVTEEFMYKLVLGIATLALSAGAASAQVPYPGYGYAPYGYSYAATTPLYDYAAPGYGYAGYGYAAPSYAAPATAGTTVVIVTPAPAYTAPTVVSPSLYAYAPGYWGGYGGYGWGGYGRWRAGWWR
jgi:hypothetical protein